MAKNNKPEDNQGGNSTKKVRKTKKVIKISHIVKPEDELGGMANQTAQAGDRYRALQHQLCR